MELIKQKLNIEKGFTLAELLLAVLILLMVSTIVATGIPVARDAYEKVVIASNAELLLSTTISTLRNELGNSKIEFPNSDGAEKEYVIYTNPSRGFRSKIYVDNNKGIMLQRYYLGSEDYSVHEDLIPDDEQLVSFTTATENLYITFSKVSYG